MRGGLQTLVLSYGSDLPGEGGARKVEVWSSSILSVSSVAFAGSMFKRRILEMEVFENNPTKGARTVRASKRPRTLHANCPETFWTV